MTKRWLILVIWFLVLVAVIICTIPLLFPPDVDGHEVSTTIDKDIEAELVGIWREGYTQECITGESLIIYYGDKTFEEHFTYFATDDCKYGDGKLLKVGESHSGVRMGGWYMLYGYLYYTDSRGITISRIKVLSIDKEKAEYIWDNKETCEGYRVDINNG
jgi:hypothetical protein